MKKIIFLLSFTAIIAVIILGIWTIVGAIMLHLSLRWVLIIALTMTIASIGASYTKYPIALLTHEADLEATYFFNISLNFR